MNDSDSVNMLSIGANEVWFHVVSREPRQCAQSDPDLAPVQRRNRMERIICASRHILNTFKTTQPQRDYDHYFVLLRISY